MTYKAPEMIKSSKTQSYSNKVDIWALNTILFHLLTGTFYFVDQNNSLIYNILNKEFDVSSYGFKPELAELLTKGYMKHPNQRPNIDEYLKSPVFNQCHLKYKKYWKPSQ